MWGKMKIEDLVKEIEDSLEDEYGDIGIRIFNLVRSTKDEVFTVREIADKLEMQAESIPHLAETLLQMHANGWIYKIESSDHFYYGSSSEAFEKALEKAFEKLKNP